MHSEFTMHIDTYLFTAIVKLSYCPFKKINRLDVKGRMVFSYWSIDYYEIDWEQFSLFTF